VAGIGTFISPGRSLERAITRARLADELGFESVHVTQIAGRDALIVLSAYAVTTNRIRLGTGVLPIFSRTPVATAQAAATIDELSGGRMVLGLGVSHQVTVENWFDSKIEKPVTQMREYAGIVRAILRGEQPAEGKYFNTKFRFMGYDARPDLPVYMGGLSPKMLQLAGEIADGVMLWVCNHDYVRDVVIPEVTKGREKVDKPLEGFDVVAAVPAALTDDRGAALDALRQELVTYFSLPFYRAAIERSGCGDDLRRFDEGMQAGDVEKAKAGISEGFLDSLGAIGSEDQVKAGVKRYLEAGTTSPCVAGIPGTDFEATLGTVAELLPESAPE
jgi:alkanesulfonate monooxygenase SsuD/methylene tetrahydromethanopterin reductase-like flavin-dependent oxidoreductase (luciferase family)